MKPKQHTVDDANRMVKTVKPTKRPERTVASAAAMAGVKLEKVRIKNLSRNDARGAVPLDPNSKLARYIEEGRRDPFARAGIANRRQRFLQERKWAAESVSEPSNAKK